MVLNVTPPSLMHLVQTFLTKPHQRQRLWNEHKKELIRIGGAITVVLIFILLLISHGRSSTTTTQLVHGDDSASLNTLASKKGHELTNFASDTNTTESDAESNPTQDGDEDDPYDVKGPLASKPQSLPTSFDQVTPPTPPINNDGPSLTEEEANALVEESQKAREEEIVNAIKKQEMEGGGEQDQQEQQQQQEEEEGPSLAESLANAVVPTTLTPTTVSTSTGTATNQLSNPFGSEARSRISRITRVKDVPDVLPSTTQKADSLPIGEVKALTPMRDEFDSNEQRAADEWLNTNYTSRASSQQYRAGIINSEGVFESTQNLPDHVDSALARNLSIVWDFGAGGCTGWAMEAANLVLGLEPYIDRLAIVSGDDFCPGMDADSLEVLQRLRLQSVKDWTIDIFISHKPPQRYPTFPYKGLKKIPDEPLFVVGRSMTEVHRIPNLWVENIMKMVDEVWIPSASSKPAFTLAGVPTEKIQVIPEPVDEVLYDPLHTEPFTYPGLRKFNFLSIFKLEPRKGWKILIKGFMEEFSSHDDVSLFIHTYLFNDPTPYDVDKIRRTIMKYVRTLEFPGRNFTSHPLPLPNLEILSGQTPLTDMPRLYKTFQAFVLPTHGEGWGLPLMEAMAMGLPCIATNWGGQLAFMNSGNSYLLPVDSFVEAEGGDFEQGAKWAVPSISVLKEAMRHMYEFPSHTIPIGARARTDVVDNFNRHAVTEVILDRLTALHPIILERRAARASGQKIVRGSHLTLPPSILHNPTINSGMLARRGDSAAKEEMKLAAEQLELEFLRKSVEESEQSGWKGAADEQGDHGLDASIETTNNPDQWETQQVEFKSNPEPLEATIEDNQPHANQEFEQREPLSGDIRTSEPEPANGGIHNSERPASTMRSQTHTTEARPLTSDTKHTVKLNYGSNGSQQSTHEHKKTKYSAPAARTRPMPRQSDSSKSYPNSRQTQRQERPYQTEQQKQQQQQPSYPRDTVPDYNDEVDPVIDHPSQQQPTTTTTSLDPRLAAAKQAAFQPASPPPPAASSQAQEEEAEIVYDPRPSSRSNSDPTPRATQAHPYIQDDPNRIEGRWIDQTQAQPYQQSNLDQSSQYQDSENDNTIAADAQQKLDEYNLQQEEEQQQQEEQQLYQQEVEQQLQQQQYQQQRPSRSELDSEEVDDVESSARQPRDEFRQRRRPSRHHSRSSRSRQEREDSYN